METKVCRKCLEKKPLSSFSFKSKGTLQSKCKDCVNKYSRLHYKTNRKHYRKKIVERERTLREFIIQLKDNQRCTDCGKRFRWWILDFDHLGDKRFGISEAVCKGYSKKTILEEICKCQLVCANCHRTRTFKDYYSKVP